jgi:hypothetical protein
MTSPLMLTRFLSADMAVTPLSVIAAILVSVRFSP